MLVTTRQMKGISIDVARRRARVAAGVIWPEVIDEAARHGLAPLSGSAPDVGVTGYTLGGGQSPVLGPSLGYAADHVHSLDVVTADGQLRTVTAESEPDLFWALRGCKGNFTRMYPRELRGQAEQVTSRSDCMRQVRSCPVAWPCQSLMRSMMRPKLRFDASAVRSPSASFAAAACVAPRACV
ncbi:FAD-binding protein [Amycolatopsis sp. NPDC005232]|uniref:FAD-binding oxidoreductase n=1 Tax=Amycolatopsis sp. NPDC005232 TaxID=3157027 RepID=UPI0033BA508D